MRLIATLLMLIVADSKALISAFIPSSDTIRFGELVDKKTVTAKEYTLRYKIFTKAAKFVSNQNDRGLSFRSEVNKFAVMTPDELELYHGVNSSITMTTDNASRNTKQVPWPETFPRSLSWIEKKHVTSIKNQDGCGACWTFGPVVAIEGMYKKMTGKLKEFSNQELLDCVYDHMTYNGCHGGRETVALDFVKRSSRLGLWRDYPYEPSDKKCRRLGKPNGLKAATVDSYSLNDGTEASTISRLSQGPLSVAFHAILSIHFYKDGIYKDAKCGTTANHAVAAVAYTPTYILIKNSWGDDWGLSGLFKFSRNDVACGIHKPENNFFVNLVLTGDVDHDEEDKYLEFIDNDENPVPTDTPLTTQSDCADKIEGCLEMFCNWYANYKDNCRKTCGYC